MRNEKIIDDERFPPHVSLHIGSAPVALLDALWDRLETHQLAHLLPTLVPAEVEKRTRGYVSLRTDIAPELRQLHERNA